jgi:hypothetical protein
VNEEPRRATGVSIAGLLVSGLAGVGVPPSLPLPSISETESRLLQFDLPLLFGASAAALVAVVFALSENHRVARFFCMISIILINVAGLLSGQFGEDGIGFIGTLVMTSPLAMVVVVQEGRQRRIHQQRASEFS